MPIVKAPFAPMQMPESGWSSNDKAYRNLQDMLCSEQGYQNRPCKKINIADYEQFGALNFEG